MTNGQKLMIATSQFEISANISTNLKTILQQIRIARSKGADIIHFAECCLVGYAGLDFTDFKNHGEEKIQAAVEKVKSEASKSGIWVILGSHHFTEYAREKPMNSLYLINNKGIVVDRYDKRFLASAGRDSDQKYYSPGNMPVTFTLRGTLCGLLICHEWRYTELYREYKTLGVELIFQSFYDGNLSPGQYRKEGKELGELLVGTMKGNAANNHLWISASNTSKKESLLPAMVLQPDGFLFNKLHRNRSGVLISHLDMDKEFIDPSQPWRTEILKKNYRDKEKVKS